MMGWAKQAVVFCGLWDESHFRTTITTLLTRIYIHFVLQEREIQRYALLMMANKPETALYRTPTFSLLLVSHGGLVHGNC